MGYPLRRLAIVAVSAATAVALAACGSSSKAASSSSASGAAKATSAADLGGMDALVAAAKKEGTLNVITLPRDWANYGEIMDGFTAKYGIKINDANPEGSSQDEIDAIKTLKGQGRAPDVLDLGGAFAQTADQTHLLAPYKVATYGDLPAGAAATDSTWYYDYGGYISIGCDAKKINPCPKTFADLKNPMYKGKVALNGDPTKAGAAFAAVYAASIANGGTFDNIQPGIDFFAALKKEGNFNPVQSTSATIGSGETPITIDWDYLNSGYVSELKAKGVDWTVSVPSDGLYANYYCQAISATAPHPAAARLWEEYLYSDAGQNLFLKGMARPARLDAMTTAKTVDASLLSALPAVSGTAKFPTNDQITAAKAALVAKWSAAMTG